MDHPSITTVFCLLRAWRALEVFVQEVFADSARVWYTLFILFLLTQAWWRLYSTKLQAQAGISRLPSAFVDCMPYVLA